MRADKLTRAALRAAPVAAPQRRFSYRDEFGVAALFVDVLKAPLL